MSEITEEPEPTFKDTLIRNAKMATFRTKMKLFERTKRMAIDAANEGKRSVVVQLEKKEWCIEQEVRNMLKEQCDLAVALLTSDVKKFSVKW